MTINETRPMTVANVSRDVNHLNVTFPSSTYDTFNEYWDKQTGLVVATQARIYSSHASANMTLTATSLWHQPGGEGTQQPLIFGLSLQQLLLIGGVVAVAVVASTLIVIHRRRRVSTQEIISEL